MDTTTVSENRNSGGLSGGENRRSALPARTRFVAYQTMMGFLAALAMLPHECRSASGGTPPDRIPGPDPGNVESVGGSLSSSDMESSGWDYVDTGAGEREWIVIGAGSDMSAAAPGAATGEEMDVAKGDIMGWQYVDTGEGHLELVVDSSAEPLHGSRTEADTSIDRSVDMDSGIFDMGPAVVQDPQVPVTARPAVITASGMVHFICEDPRMESFEVQVMDISGRIVFSSSRRSTRDLPWDLRNDRGQPLPQGVYFFRAIVHPSESARPSAGTGRIVILGKPIPTSY